MLFLTYWELNEDASIEERNQAARGLTESGTFPNEGVEIVRWDVTPDGWGILIMEADSPEAAFTGLNLWRAASPGFFKSTKTAPMLPVQDAIRAQSEMLAGMGGG